MRELVLREQKAQLLICFQRERLLITGQRIPFLEYSLCRIMRLRQIDDLKMTVNRVCGGAVGVRKSFRNKKTFSGMYTCVIVR